MPRFAGRPLPRPVGLAVLTAAALAPRAASAHVKWFSDFSFADPPLSAAQVLTPTFWGFAALTVFALGALVLLDQRLAGVAGYVRIGEWLAGYRDRSLLVLRVAAGVVMLLNWQASVLLAPELGGVGAWAGWAQFAVAVLLLFRQSVPLAGAGLLLLYGYCVVHFGAFHMLDYLYLLGFGVAFLVSTASTERVRAIGLVALYATVGFSLFWVALDKLVYPEWALYVLTARPQLTLGFPVHFFLIGAAFVEMALGYLLLIGLLERPLALAITLVFFATTLVFGKLEVIGHTMIHAALIVFLIEGTGGVYKPPVRFHRATPLRVAFAGVNFAVVLAVLLVPYAWGAHRMYVRAERGDLPPASQARPGEALPHAHASGEAYGD